MKKQITPEIMNDERFAEYLECTKKKVKEWQVKGYDNNAVRCRMIGWITGREDQAFTGDQLEQIFDIAF